LFPADDSAEPYRQTKYLTLFKEKDKEFICPFFTVQTKTEK